MEAYLQIMLIWGNGKDIYIGHGNIIANYNWWGNNAKVAIPKKCSG